MKDTTVGVDIAKAAITIPMNPEKRHRNTYQAVDLRARLDGARPIAGYFLLTEIVSSEPSRSTAVFFEPVAVGIENLSTSL